MTLYDSGNHNPEFRSQHAKARNDIRSLGSVAEVPSFDACQRPQLWRHARTHGTAHTGQEVAGVRIRILYPEC